MRRSRLTPPVPLGVLASYAAQPAAQDARYTYAATVICQLASVGYLSALVHRRRRVADVSAEDGPPPEGRS